LSDVIERSWAPIALFCKPLCAPSGTTFTQRLPKNPGRLDFCRSTVRSRFARSKLVRLLILLIVMTVLPQVSFAATKHKKTPSPVAPIVAVPPAAPAESDRLKKCLKRADDLPDIAAAEAGAWIKQGGGDEAHLCRAFSQENRGMHADAARDFWALASAYKKKNAARALDMDNLAGQEFLRANDSANAILRFDEVIKIAPRLPAGYIGRAASLMATEKYWEAIVDLDRALALDPKNVEALRQRGRAWHQLGNDKNAQEDLGAAADLAGDTPGNTPDAAPEAAPDATPEADPLNKPAPKSKSEP
jgi:tetratricopeptide (TPR) repeat protein